MILPNNSVYFDEEMEKIINFCSMQYKQECLVVGNGPSASSVVVDDSFLEKNFICRCNWFFLEKNKNFGSRVDAYFYSVYNEYLYRNVSNLKYNIKSIFRPFKIVEDSIKPKDLLYSKIDRPVFDHWSVISNNKKLAYMMMNRPLPTQGVQMIAFAAIVGFKIINVAGIDFYNDINKRYNYNIKDEYKKYLKEKDINPGYEKDHELNNDLKFLKSIIDEYNIQINCISDMPVMNEFLATIRG